MADYEQEAPGGRKEAGKRDDGWERELVNRLAFSSLNEQRRARRWSILFKLLTFAYLVALLLMFRQADWTEKALRADNYVGLVELEGIISASAKASADNVVTGLRAAFEDENTAAVILRINSPGGSPVQAGYINDEIMRLREKYPDTPFYAVISDVCASGGYYVAAAADKIYADKASVVGSIGVRMDSFGFVDAMEKLGIERRLMTAGEHKGFLDPFLPENPDDVEHVKTLLGDIHQQFIDVVKAGRGDRLKDDPKLFSGLVWTGEQGIELGLVDELGSAGYVAREVVGVEDIVDFTPKEDFLERFGKGVGASMGSSVKSLLESWSLR